MKWGLTPVSLLKSSIIRVLVKYQVDYNTLAESIVTQARDNNDNDIRSKIWHKRNLRAIHVQ